MSLADRTAGVIARVLFLAAVLTAAHAGAAHAQEGFQEIPGAPGVPTAPPRAPTPVPNEVPQPMPLPLHPMLQLRDQFMFGKLATGFTPFTVHQNGHQLPLGFFGGEVEHYFTGSPEELAAARSYRSKRITGFSLWMVGVGLLAVNLAWEFAALAQHDTTLLTDNLLPFLVVLGAGATMGAIGGVMMGTATSDLANAVNLHNAALRRLA